MDSFDLFKVPRHRVNQTINAQYGGRYTGRDLLKGMGTGTAGLSFIEKNENEEIRLKVNLERLKEGMAVYFRNIDHNKVLLFRFDEIEHIKITKEADLLVQKRPSLFNWLYHSGINYFWSRVFLLEKEIISTYPVEVIIQIKEFEPILLFCSRRNPARIVRYLEGLQPFVPLTKTVELFRFMHQGLGD